MYAQNQQAPYLQAVPNYSAPDTVEQLGKFVDIVDKIRAPQVGSTNTSAYNTSAFQSNPDLLAIQELLLRNPSLNNFLVANNQNQANQQYTQPGLTLEQSKEVRFNVDKVLKGANEHYQNLQRLQAISDSLMNVVNYQQIEIQALEKVAYLAGITKRCFEATANELNAVYNKVEVQDRMLNSPEYLLTRFFEIMFATVTVDDSDIMNVLSDDFLSLISSYEDKLRAKTGQYSPSYQKYLQEQINKGEPNQNNLGLETQASYQQVMPIVDVNSPGLANSLRRQHLQNRAMVK
jgi:hypothetical protein